MINPDVVKTKKEILPYLKGRSISLETNSGYYVKVSRKSLIEVLDNMTRNGRKIYAEVEAYTYRVYINLK